MTDLAHFANTASARALGWTLFHSLWEGALIALILLAVLLTVRSPRARYAWACVAMLGVLAAFVITFGLQVTQGSGSAAAIRRTISEAPLTASSSSPDVTERFRFEDALPWLAPFWIAGVVVFHLRSLAGWLSAQRLRSRGVCQAPDPWPSRLQHLSARLRVTVPVTLLETCLAEVPVVIGYLRPVILVPVGMLAAMSSAQVEAILLHELAHIRRRDYLVNLLQTVVEGFLFYHPAIWWISGVIRAERENCCDDLVVSASGDAREYAAALTNLEQARRSAGQAALAATGGSLMKRIRRLLSEPEGSALAPVLSAGILTIALAGGLAAWQTSAPAPKAQPQVSPYTKWIEEDVVYIIKGDERSAFLRLQTDPERQHFIEQFWQRRDPTPGTPANEFKEEHYRRIAYANAHFAAKLPGSRTDRGRMYIVYGPPDEIESHPNGHPAAGNSPAIAYPSEEWRYRHLEGIADNVIMEFIDPQRTGEFKMTMDPNPGTGKYVPQP